MSNGSRALLSTPRRGLAARLGLHPESAQFLHLDALRFIAAAGVVAFHYREWLSWRSSPVPLAALFGFGQFVDLFFVVSGIVITELYRSRITDADSYGRFLLKRVARLVPLHWLTLAFFVAIAIGARRYGNDGGAGEWPCLLPNITLTQSFGLCDRLSFNTPSWSISAEMALYLSFPATLALATRPRWGWAAWLTIVAALALLDSGRGGEPWYARTFDGGAMRAVPAFLFGALIAGTPALARIRWPAGLMWLTLAAFVGMRVADVAPGLRVAMVYLVPLFGLVADRRRVAGAAVRALAPWGQLTYSLYMWHLPVAWVCLLIGARRLGLTGAAMNGAVVATAVIVLPAVAAASLHWFEGPMRRAIGSAGRRATVASDFAP